MDPVAAMSRGEKFIKAAHYLRCVEPCIIDGQKQKCPCEGWKNAQAAPLLVDAKSHSYEDAGCASCNHKLSSHGDLLNIKLDELDRKIRFVLRLEQLGQDYAQTQDSRQRELITQQRNDLKAQLLGPPRPPIIKKPAAVPAPAPAAHVSPAPTAVAPAASEAKKPEVKTSAKNVDEPPFERPSISIIFRNFVEYKYAARTNDNRYAPAQRLVTALSNLMNLPTFLDMPEKSHKLLRERLSPTVEQRWLRWCSKGQHKLTDVFGRSVLRALLPGLKEVGKARLSDVESIYAQFFKDLEKDVAVEDSLIFSDEFTEKWTILRQLDESLEANEDIEGGPAARKMQLELIEKYMPKRAAPAPEALVKQEAGLKADKPVVWICKVPPETFVETCRDADPRKEERNGILTTELISNDGTRRNLRYLLDLKNIFSRQLPKMPKDYIVRLVFDRGHRTLALFKRDSPDATHWRVIGGICFRPFTPNFMEIAFCAITATEQVRGYGTHMMNHLKEAMREIGMMHFLTFADNFAVGYFKKQGFTREIRLPYRWQGFIKDYDGGTLMHCVLNAKVNYLDMPGLVRRQREAIQEKLKSVSKNHVVYNGISFDPNNPQEIMKIAGIKDSKYVETMQPRGDPEQLHAFLDEVMRELLAQEDSVWPFLKPVDRVEVPDYYNVIKDPIDLSAIQARLDTKKYYITKDIFYADIKRMCDNCRTYNKPDSVYFACAQEVDDFVSARLRRAPVPGLPLPMTM